MLKMKNAYDIFIILILLAILSSCSPCKRLYRKCPPQVITERYDSIIIKDTIIYKDKIINYYIKGETDTVEKFVPVYQDISPLSLENDYAKASAWVYNSKLKLSLTQKDQIIKFKLDSADKIIKHWEYRFENEKRVEIHNIKYIPRLYKIALGISILSILAFVYYIYNKFK